MNWMLKLDKSYYRNIDKFCWKGREWGGSQIITHDHKGEGGRVSVKQKEEIICKILSKFYLKC